MLPNWLGLGPGRSGTTTLYEILKTHPDAYLAPAKECNFFSSESTLTPVDLAYYEATFFGGYGGQRSVGEISPRYFPSCDAIRNIRALLGPDVRFIVTLRHPVDRAWSHYKHELKNLYEVRSFDEVMNGVPTASGMRRAYGDIYVGHSLYAKSIENWLAVFPRENFLILSFEDDIERNLRSTLSRVCAHLGIADVLEFTETIRINRNLDMTFQLPDERARLGFGNSVAVLCEWEPWNRVINQPSDQLVQVMATVKKNSEYTLNSTDRSRYFDQVFAQDVIRLERILGRDFSMWREPKADSATSMGS